MLGGRGRDGTICGCFETFVQTDHLGGLETPQCGGAGGAWGLPRGRALPTAPLHPKFGIDPGFGLAGLRPRLLLRPWPRREGDVQRLTSCPQRGEQTNFKNRLKIFTGSGPLAARRLRAAPAEAEEEPRKGREGEGRRPRGCARLCARLCARSLGRGAGPEPGLSVLPARSPNTAIVRESVCSIASLVTALKPSVQIWHFNFSDASWKP